MIDVILTTLLFAAVIGWAMTWHDLKRENARLFVAAISAAQERNEALDFARRVRTINHQLGVEMQARGFSVTLVGCGEPDCENCGDEWPETLEIKQR